MEKERRGGREAFPCPREPVCLMPGTRGEPAHTAGLEVGLRWGPGGMRLEPPSPRRLVMGEDSFPLLLKPV